MEKSNSGEVSPASDSSDASQKPNPNPVFKGSTVPPVRFWILTVGICLGLFLSMIDTSIVATSIYSIGVDFKDVRRVNWVALAYTLAYLGCAVTFARISDVVGRRKAFIASYVLFLAFSLGCGFSRTLDQLIVCRTLQGIGGSGLYSVSMILLPEICPDHLTQHIGSVIGLVIAAAGALGPVLGGILTHLASWRWIFWINGPIGVISIVIIFIAWPKSEQMPSMTRRSWKEFDYFGSVLIIPAAVLVVFAFQNAGESLDTKSVWSQASFIAPLTIGLALWLALIAWGYLAGRFLKDRVALTFPIVLFRNRAYLGAAISTLFLGFPYFILSYSFPLRAQVVAEKSSLIAGVMLLPMVAAASLGTFLTGFISRTKNYLFETMLGGVCLMTLGISLLTIVHSAKDDSKALGFIFLVGLGFGFTVASATMLTSLEVPIRDYAPAQGIMAQFRILGGSLGISTSTVLLSKKASQVLLESGQLLSAEQRDAVHRAYSEAFHSDMVVGAATAAAAVLIVLVAYRRGRMLVKDQKEARVREEIARQMGL